MCKVLLVAEAVDLRHAAETAARTEGHTVYGEGVVIMHMRIRSPTHTLAEVLEPLRQQLLTACRHSSVLVWMAPAVCVHQPA